MASANILAGEPQPSCRTCFTMLVAILVIVAAAWAGWNAYQEQQGRTLPLDLDGWGHLVSRLDSSGHNFLDLLHDPSLWKGPVIPFIFGICYFLFPFTASILVLNVIAFAAATG